MKDNIDTLIEQGVTPVFLRALADAEEFAVTADVVGRDVAGGACVRAIAFRTAADVIYARRTDGERR